MADTQVAADQATKRGLLERLGRFCVRRRWVVRVVWLAITIGAGVAARDLGNIGVRVNAIAPGLIRTDFARMLWEGERGDEVARGYPLQRLGEPEDIAEAVAFLASDAGGYLTGQTLHVNGGMVMP